jgi:hypothetical protein
MMQELQVAIADLEDALKIKAIVNEGFVTVGGSVERKLQGQSAGSCGKCSQCAKAQARGSVNENLLPQPN